MLPCSETGLRLELRGWGSRGLEAKRLVGQTFLHGTQSNFSAQCPQASQAKSQHQDCCKPHSFSGSFGGWRNQAFSSLLPTAFHLGACLSCVPLPLPCTISSWTWNSSVPVALPSPQQPSRKESNYSECV